MLVQSVVPCDAIAFFEPEGEVLSARFAAGASSSALRRLRVPLGEGLVGWVSQRNLPIVNGNPLVEPGYHGDGTALRSALAVPVALKQAAPGVCALYRRHADAFNSADFASLTHCLTGDWGALLAMSVQASQFTPVVAKLTATPRPKSDRPYLRILITS